MSLYTQSQLAELASCTSPVEMRKLTLKWEKEAKASLEIETKRSLAKTALGELYLRFSLQQSLHLSHLDDVQGLALLNEYKDALPVGSIIGSVSFVSKNEESLLGVFMDVVNVETKAHTVHCLAIGKNEKTRAGKTVVSVGSIEVTECLGKFLLDSFFSDFPSLKPVEEIALVDGELKNAA